MTDREALLRKISVARFAAWELHIYLDTHPRDERALKMYQKYQEQADRLTTEYENKYGPLMANDAFGDGGWQWTNDPWPWENTEVTK